jgi:hypothetical protein
MTHKTRHEQLALKIRKGNNPKVRGVKVHTPKPAYDRKKKRQELHNYLSQGKGTPS